MLNQVINNQDKIFNDTVISSGKETIEQHLQYNQLKIQASSDHQTIITILELKHHLIIKLLLLC